MILRDDFQEVTSNCGGVVTIGSWQGDERSIQCVSDSSESQHSQGMNMKTIHDVNKIERQLSEMLGDGKDKTKTSMIDETGSVYAFFPKTYRRLRGRLQIVGHDMEKCNWRFSEKILDELESMEIFSL